MVAGGVHGCQGCVHGCWGACMVAGGHAWLEGCAWLQGACMVAGGGLLGVCMVTGEHVWLLGVCLVAGGVHGCWGGACVGYDEIQSMSGRYASYWNAFLFQYVF